MVSFTNKFNRFIYINPDQVCSINACGVENSHVNTSDGREHLVRETSDKVAKKLEDAKRAWISKIHCKRCEELEMRLDYKTRQLQTLEANIPEAIRRLTEKLKRIPKDEDTV